MQQHFFLGPAYLGQSARRPFLARGLDYHIEPSSLFFWCKVCGEVYAKAPVVRGDGTTVAWRAIPHYCQRCSPTQFTSNPPGSLYPAQGCDPEIIAAFPNAVLRWEYDRHCEWFDRDCPEKVTLYEQSSK